MHTCKKDLKIIIAKQTNKHPLPPKKQPPPKKEQPIATQ